MMRNRSNVKVLQSPAAPSGPRTALVRVRAVLAAGGVALCACQAVPPVVSTALVGFGQDVLAAAAQNFAPQYAASMQDLFFAMAESATGMPFTQVPEDSGEPGAGETYAEGQYVEGQYAEGQYAEGQYAEGQEAEGQDADEQYPEEQYPGQYAQETYPEPSYDEGEYAQGAYDPAAYTTPGYVDSAAPPPAGYGAPAGIALEVALLAQQSAGAGRISLRPVQDGDVLRDGRGDPARGDKIKVFFSASCACHVYVIGIDATGYVAQIFPESGGNASSLVAPGARYLLPGGTTWWGLDNYRGVEQIYFIASRERRSDIETLVTQLAGRRPNVPANYRPVREPAIVPTQRGLVQVQSAAPTVIATEHGAGQAVSPTLFQSTVVDADLVITRWFRHE